MPKPTTFSDQQALPKSRPRISLTKMSQLRIPKKKDRQRPCTPLMRIKWDKAAKEDLLVYKCQIDPADSDSEVYDKTCRVFKGGEPDEWIMVLQDLDKMWTANDNNEPLH